jgi:hypothetical protein
VVKNVHRCFVVLSAAIVLAAAETAAAQSQLVQEAADPATGAVVRLFRSAGGPALEIDTPDLRLRKRLDGRTVITTISAGDASLAIKTDDQSLTVTDADGNLRVTRDDAAGLDEARRRIGRSPLARRAAALIGNIGFGPSSPVVPVLLTTRAFLLAATGDDRGADELRSWIRQARSRVQVVRVSQDRTADECWKEYTKEALAAWDEFSDCMLNIKWWNPFGESGCLLVYDTRALGAFSWYLDCVGLLDIIK